MRTLYANSVTLVLVVLVAVTLLTEARADNEPTGWKDIAELSLVLTDGNTETTSLGFKNKLWRAWEKSAFELNAGGINVETTKTTDLFAVGSPGSFSVTEESIDETTAESYYVNGRYDRLITDRFFWFAGAGWDKNEFAGIDSRYTVFGGVGNIWVDEETVKFRTDYALSWTKQEDVVTVPGTDDTFLGLRLSWNYWHQFGNNTTYGNDLIVDQNLDESSDLRADMINWLAVSMSERLALKLGLQMLYDKQPSFENIPLFDLDPSDPAAVNLGQVTRELDDLDTIFTASLVVNF